MWSFKSYFTVSTMIDSVYLTPVENHLHLKEKSAHTADVCVCVCVCDN